MSTTVTARRLLTRILLLTLLLAVDLAVLALAIQAEVATGACRELQKGGRLILCDAGPGPWPIVAAVAGAVLVAAAIGFNLARLMRVAGAPRGG